MKKIIALRGPGNTGKTTAINILYGLLIKDGFIHDDGTFGQNKDYWTVLDYGDRRIGVTSWGDNAGILRKKLDILTQAGSEIILCACRSYGQTNELLNSKPGFNVKYFEKTKSKKINQSSVNNADAQELLTRIKGLL